MGSAMALSAIFLSNQTVTRRYLGMVIHDRTRTANARSPLGTPPRLKKRLAAAWLAGDVLRIRAARSRTLTLCQSCDRTYTPFAAGTSVECW
jgi:hypothetical protein